MRVRVREERFWADKKACSVGSGAVCRMLVFGETQDDSAMLYLSRACALAAAAKVSVDSQNMEIFV